MLTVCGVATIAGTKCTCAGALVSPVINRNRNIARVLAGCITYMHAWYMYNMCTICECTTTTPPPSAPVISVTDNKCSFHATLHVRSLNGGDRSFIPGARRRAFVGPTHVQRIDASPARADANIAACAALYACRIHSINIDFAMQFRSQLVLHCINILRTYPQTRGHVVGGREA